MVCTYARSDIEIYKSQCHTKILLSLTLSAYLFIYFLNIKIVHEVQDRQRQKHSTQYI